MSNESTVRWSIDKLFKLGMDYMNECAPETLRADLAAWLKVACPATPPPEPADVALTSLQTLIRHFAEVGPEQNARKLCDVIVDVVIQLAQQCQNTLPGFGKHRTFAAVAALRRAYWDSLCARHAQPRNHHQAHRVIHINDIPFAESIIPAMLAYGAGAFGYSIVVEDVPWSELGAALHNGRIDVAFTNGQIIGQLKSVETLFERKLIYRSAETITYRRYPVIGQRLARSATPRLIGVPERSDLEEIARKHGSSSSHIRVPGTWGVRAQIVNYPSADDVLEAVVDGNIPFGLVGGLQSHYAITQFSATVKHYGDLRGGNIDPAARFWVAVANRHEAEELLSAMQTLWNEVVVRDWRRVSTKEDHELSGPLLEKVNGQPHNSFISDFNQLLHLIKHHDGQIGPIKDQIERVIT